MANPRKFSEKIALHNQKQAEETAAFEQIMKEVCNATKDVSYQKQHLHINQTLGSYRGGSLPNVNQIGNNTIDLQNALINLEDMKQGREALDRFSRESRSRQIGPHRTRPCASRVDCSPYGSTYLSPPPDTSWRRTNSDSALHQSAMNQVDAYHNSNVTSNSRRVPDDGLGVDGQGKIAWDAKKQGLSPPGVQRPKSCEVPGINIYHSEQDFGVVHIPISNNTGSLPDLTNPPLQFPSPLVTPLDIEDQNTLTYNTNSLGVPSLHTRYLHTCKGLAVESLPIDTYQHTPQYLYQQTQSQQQQQQHSPPQLGISSSQALPTGTHSHMGGYRSGSPAETTRSAPQSPVSQTLSPSSSPGLGSSPKSQFSEQNYYQAQNITASTVQQSFEHFNLIDRVPASTSINSMFLSSGRSLHYSQAQNANLVDGQNLIDTSGYYNTSSSQMVQYTQDVQSPGVSGQTQQTTPQTPQTPSSIPDIILTDFSTCPTTEDAITRQDFAKDIGTAMAGISGSFETDLFPTDEALKDGLDPIDFDGFQMLTDPDLVTDPATEDSFR